MKAVELHELTTDELQLKQQELKKALFTVRFQVAMNQQDNTAVLKQNRKDVARVKTILRERQMKALKENKE